MHLPLLPFSLLMPLYQKKLNFSLLILKIKYEKNYYSFNNFPYRYP